MKNSIAREITRELIATNRMARADNKESQDIVERTTDADKAVLREIASSGRLYAPVAAQMLKNDEALDEIRKLLEKQHDR